MEVIRKATVTSKGQVTIPKDIRDALDIDEGTTVEFVLDEEGQLTVRPNRSGPERLDAVREQLAGIEVDLDAMRRESKAAWSGHGADEDAT